MKITITEFASLCAIRSDLFFNACQSVLGCKTSNNPNYDLSQENIDALGEYLDQVAIDDKCLLSPESDVRDRDVPVFGLDDKAMQQHRVNRYAKSAVNTEIACGMVRELADFANLKAPKSWPGA